MINLSGRIYSLLGYAAGRGILGALRRARLDLVAKVSQA